MGGRQIITMPNGDTQIDPFGRKRAVDKWFADVTLNGKINYDFYSDIVDPKTSELLVKFIYDLSTGKNSPRDGVKRARSYTTLSGYMVRLPPFLSRVEKFAKKPITQITKDEVLSYFKGMETGIIKTKTNRLYKDVKSYAKVFSSFWKWYCRIMHKEKKYELINIGIIHSSRPHKVTG